MSDANDVNGTPAMPVMPGATDWSVPDAEWSIPDGDLLVPMGDILGVRLRREQIGGPFVALLVELPSGIRPDFKLVDVSIGERSVTEPPYLVGTDSIRFGQWIELGQGVVDHVQFAVMCTGRHRAGSRPGAPNQRFRGVFWMRDESGRLWAEAVGWVGPQAVDSFAVWRVG